MEIRKVQMTGGSSYIITLPKEWIKASNIKKNDTVGIHKQSDGTLVISSKMTKEKQYKLKEFDISNIPKQTYLIRRLIGAYISGYTSIKITSPERIPLEIKNTIRVLTQAIIGQEVVEETDTSITLKDLLNPIEMPLDRTIKRMHIIVKSMKEDAILLLTDKEKILAEEIFIRDKEVNRLHWLVARQYNMILQNVSLAEKMDITISLSSTYFLISRIIERIGDHVVRIAKNIQQLPLNALHDELINKIQTASKFSLDIFNKSIGSFFRKDIPGSNENIDSVKKLEKLCEEINTIAIQQNAEIAIAIGYIVESIRRIGEYAEDISETVINYLIEEEH
ncbi:MAG: PhoU domain-containing protein [Thermoplasmatota archaeon]